MRLSARDIRALALIGIAVLGAMMFVAHRSRVAAEATRDAAIASLASTCDSIERYRALSAAPTQIAAGARPETELIGAIESLLGELGLPTEALKSFETPAARSVDDQSAYKQAVVNMAFEPISPVDLARTLGAWAEREPLWTVSNIRLELIGQQANRGRSTSGAPGEQYLARVTMSSLYADDPSTSESTDLAERP